MWCRPDPNAAAGYTRDRGKSTVVKACAIRRLLGDRLGIRRRLSAAVPAELGVVESGRSPEPRPPFQERARQPVGRGRRRARCGVESVPIARR